MAFNTTLRRIGIINQASASWAAASSYTTMLLRSLGDACRNANVELCLLSESEGFHFQPEQGQVRLIPLAEFGYLPGERRARSLLRLPGKAKALRGESRLRHWLKLPDSSNVFNAARAHGVQVLLPLFDLPPWDVRLKTIGWIPDFQHVYLPEFFPAAERQRRDTAMLRLAERATFVMLSSHAAQEHFKAFAPAHAGKARVLPFPSLFAFTPPGGEAVKNVSRFNLPEKFALVANQFWAHKNHLVVVEALRLLRQRGMHVSVLMTGLPADHRDPSNQNLSRLLQSIAVANLSAQVTILGQVPYADLIDLMRTATVIIQPSRFEGWSTIVQDAKALGRPLLCSDLPVHLEQAPSALGFFPCDDAQKLADLLADHWPALEPGPDLKAEARALTTEREFARLHGQSLLGLCLESCIS
jgi:glycosyltransferase involved in cell wall biosynthesis